MGSKVLIINTGGTLSSVARQHGLTPGLTTDSMLKELHIVAGEAELSTLEFSSLDSANIFPEDWAELARLISENRKRADGIVVIHGTDTLAYTSSPDSCGHYGKPAFDLESCGGRHGEPPLRHLYGPERMSGRICSFQQEGHAGMPGL